MKHALVTALLLSLAAARAAHADAPPSAEPLTAAGPEAAHDLADMALVAAAEHRYADAARLLDRAHAHAPHPLFLLAAGEHYLIDGDAARAAERFTEALASPALAPAARLRAETLEPRARAAANYARLAAAASPDAAARAWEDAFAAAQVGRFLVRAGRAWEDALDFVRADTAYSRALRRDDLPYGVAAEAAARLVHARANRPPPPPDRTWAWVTGGAAAATLAFAGVAGLVSNDHHADVRDALARDLDGPVRAMTRAEALARQSQGDDWRTAAWVGLASGAALAVTSVVLYFAAPEPTSDIRLEAAATSDGLVLFARGSL